MIIMTTEFPVILDILGCPNTKKEVFSHIIEQNLYNYLHVRMNIAFPVYTFSCVRKTKNAFTNQTPDNFSSLFN